MRKVLLGTTAMVAAGMLASAPSANADEMLKAGVGGYMQQWFSYAAQDGMSGQDYSGFNQTSEAEVHFTGDLALDNGLTVGINIQLEGNTSGDQIDETFMSIQGSFGRFLIGSENSAQYLMHYAPSEFGVALNSGYQGRWITAIEADPSDTMIDTTVDPDGHVVLNTADKINIGGYGRIPLGATFVEVGGMNDTQKITYFTPRFQGVQIGASYTPDATGGGEDSGAAPNRDVTNTDAISASVNYSQSFEDASVNASVGYGTVTRTQADDDADPTALNVGLTVNVGGFGIGASYSAFDDSGANNGEGYNVGANYSMGPWGVSLNYFHGERDGTGSDGMGTLVGHAAMNTVQLSTKYDLGPGINTFGTLGHTGIESDDSDLDDSVDDIASTYLVVGVRVSY